MVSRLRTGLDWVMTVNWTACCPGAGVRVTLLIVLVDLDAYICSYFMLQQKNGRYCGVMLEIVEATPRCFLIQHVKE